MTEAEDINDCCKRVEARLNYLAGNPEVERDTGAVGRIEKHLEAQNDRYSKLFDSHNKLKLTVYCLIAMLIGSGIITGSLVYAL